jgi:2,5-diamino-6-(ribosylamino)-4(3H)-pyrimidinone 5'-phosphate reductase
MRAIVVPCWPFPTAAGAYEYLHYLKERHINYIIAGQDHVDLCVALAELNSRFGVKVVRVDAGGTLNGQLLRQGLVDELSLLIYPSLVGGEKQSSIFRAPDQPEITSIAANATDTTTADPVTGPRRVISLKLLHMEKLKGEVIWLRYEVN